MLSDIIGHDRQKEQILRAITANSLPHAYLFAGTDGIGKRLLANAIGRILLCTKDASEYCKCESCIKVEKETHPDLTQTLPEDNLITIDKIREIKEQLKFPPLLGNRRIIIIDQAELMNTNAANAALKILEEPPAGNHFFIITSTPHRLPATIVSRCQKIQFSPLANSQIEKCLISKHNYTKEQAMAAAKLSEGAIGKALGINPEVITTTQDDFLRVCQTQSAEGIINLSSKWSATKEEIGDVLYILHRTFHNALLEKSDTSKINLTDPLTIFITGHNSQNNLVEKCDLLTKSHYYATRTYNKQLMFEQLLFSLTA